jgi:hypothetical protein
MFSLFLKELSGGAALWQIKKAGMDVPPPGRQTILIGLFFCFFQPF